MPHVTVVVLHWCDEEVSRACLASLRRVELPELRVLLVDNGSHDGSGERLRDAFPEVDFHQLGSNVGYAGGNNRGIEWALSRGADYVLILNNDAEVEPECVGHLVDAAVSGGSSVAGVVPKILYHHDPDRIWYAGGHFSPLRGLGLHWREGEPDSDPAGDGGSREVTFMTGCCCLLSAEALRRVGGFEEELFAYVEDAELSLRFAEAGYRMLYQPAARVFHQVPGPGSEPSPFQIRQRDRNRRWVMRHHFPLTRRIPFLVRFYATRFVLLARYLTRGDLPRVRAIVDGALGSTNGGQTPPLP